MLKQILLAGAAATTLSTTTVAQAEKRNDPPPPPPPALSSCAFFAGFAWGIDAIHSHAERAPFPNPDRVAQHGERAVLISSFAMIEMMASAAIDKIGQQTGWQVADGHTQ